MKLAKEDTAKIQNFRKRSNLGIFLLFGNFLKNGLMTFSFFCIQLLGDDIDQLSRDEFD